MKFELFVFDLDGTLLDSAGRLSFKARQFVERLKKRARVTLATGRSLFSAQPYIKALNIHEPVILYHGAVVFCPRAGKPLREVHLSQEAVRSVLSIAKSFPVDIQLYRSVFDKYVYVSSLSPAVVEFSQKENLPLRHVPDLLPMAKGEVLKLLFIGEAETLQALREALEGVEATVVRSEWNYLEVLPKGISKGAGLAWLCQELGLSPERVVAVGDQESDVPMFEVAGLGVTLAHAPRAVREKADLVILSVEELEGHWGTG